MENISLASTNMVESQLRPNDVTNPRLLAEFLRVPRENFVPGARRALSYADQDVELKPAGTKGPARYLMQPMTFGRMVQLADVKPTDLVLDVGCGTGYSAAILSALADSVVALECDEDLAAIANDVLPALQIANAAVVTGPLPQGYAAEGPYDVIVVNGQLGAVPGALCDQLKEGGRLVAVLEEGGVRRIWVFHRHDGKTTGIAGFNAAAPVLPGFEPEEEFVF
ncbi:MAG: protein-L-isoaspartate O-methyltransferase [Rhodobiaceae bacterium]|nr:protein-L-isoaspartate O-methyltransferase [Rhodobiaceae bacterium]